MQSFPKTLTATCFTLLLVATSMGCMETPAASPALLDENLLEEYGWVQDADVEYNTFQQNISDSNSISFSSTVVRYKNERLAADITGQTKDFKETWNIPFDPGIPMMGAWISTRRITLPSGATLPTGLVSKMTDSSVSDMSQQNNIRSFSKIETRELTMKDGSIVSVSIYSGSVPSQNSSLSVLAVVAAFGDEDSSTIVMGMAPDGSLPVRVGNVEADLFSIDGRREIEEMLELIATIE
ncbi:MAG: hypothetical protein JW705_06110 [Methanosarcinaceae archaeon]|nr:hypothetical protein [Methanosarcinaceae archaeon]